MTRGGLTDYEQFALLLCSAVSGEWNLIGLEQDEVLNLIENFCESTDLSEGIEQAVQDVFIPAQNALMNYRRDDFYKIQEEPPFSEFGRENLVKFLNAWEQGGQAALEEVFNETFFDGSKIKKPKNEIIRILSGDGKTQETAIKFSTNEMLKRIRAEFCYVYYMFGKDWTHTHSTVYGNGGKAFSFWNLQFPNGDETTLYFDTNSEI